MVPKIIGGDPLEKDDRGELKYNMGLVFPDSDTIVVGKGSHCLVREKYIGYINQKRREKGLDGLSIDQEVNLTKRYVDLVIRGDNVYIRPGKKPSRSYMETVFRADEVLQQAVPEQKIKFLGVDDSDVRKFIKQRGELWRISSLPRTTEGMKKLIKNSKVAIGGSDMYYHNAMTGTRYLTYDGFSGLEELDKEELAKSLTEIQEYITKRNHLNNPELKFFKADKKIFWKNDFKKDFSNMDEDGLNKEYLRYKKRFFEAVSPEFRKDNYNNLEWREIIYEALVKRNDEISEDVLMGLCPELRMHIRWLPGAYMEKGTICLFDPIFKKKDGKDLEELCDDNVKGFIDNFQNEYSNIEYVNMGKLVQSISKRKKMPGRRDVYIAEIKIPKRKKEIIKMLRMQKFGMREYMKQGMSKDEARKKSEQGVQYALDCHLGCQQLGMNVIPIRTGRISEKYDGDVISSAYFEREYIEGTATDKVQPRKLSNREYALAFFSMLGKTAAVNAIVNRSYEDSVLFDDGDEYLIEDKNGMPKDIMVAEVTGAFNNHCRDLEECIEQYAEPINKRMEHLRRKDVNDLVCNYIDKFIVTFKKIKEGYIRHRDAYDIRFTSRGIKRESIPERWEKTLKRMTAADPEKLGGKIYANIKK
ncbi:hypothetical protein GF336_01545 [Candidatus Woesearchaeota archaeon]|nr:hypothetical protein [Candidatus Woesearchaeota archaeon]